VSIRIQIVTEHFNPISAAIRFETRSWCSHIEFKNTADQTTLGARSMGGVRIRPCAKDHYTKVEQFTAAGIGQAYEWAKTQTGKPYDFSAITGMAINRDWRNESKYFCSELIALAFEKAGSPVLSTRPSVGVYRITPRDLLLSRTLFYLSQNE
jgi:uncharacterized protein YycO